MIKLGGSSGVVTGDTREEVIEEAKKWYSNASTMMLEPRTFIYGKGETEIEYFHCHDKDCPYCCGEAFKANIIIVDTAEKPANAKADTPFPLFNNWGAQHPEKRFHAFVSAHA